MGFLSNIRKMKRTADKVSRTAKKIDRSAQDHRKKTLKAKFYQGQISASEFESEFSGQNAGIKVILEDVNGVGESTSQAIAQEYENLADLEGTDRERLESVRGVGPSTADAVLDLIR
ncbi:helix-hairpin-helix domain-containing protein [Haloterrigena alkaliphila]|nr:helix-hairpin-helix domain-containing protein [Haloterrigena alkaliphila]QSX01164.2 helix-hairpin-helix domain-containing protein [Haloterrigena alkaliphila]